MAQKLHIDGRFGFHNIELTKSEENSLGNGSYGAVYKAKCNQLVCAAKFLHCILVRTGDPSAHRITERFQQEIDFLNNLRHPNIVQYLGSCTDPKSGETILFMELMDESLTNFLERPPNHLPPLHVQVDIGHDVAQALSYLHDHDLLHRDLSSNNVLLIGNRRAKVTDFGMAKILGSDTHNAQTHCPGANVYMSPEALAEPPSYKDKLDIFSCGVLFVQLITRKFPNPGPTTRTVEVQNNPLFPSGRARVEIPELERRKEHLDLISPTDPLLKVALLCLKDKEDQRPTAKELCSSMVELKESHAYQESLEQTKIQTNKAMDQEKEQKMRDTIADLTKQVHELKVHQLNTKNRQLKQQIVEKDTEIQQLQQQKENLRKDIQVATREKEQVVNALQNNVKMKDAALREKDAQIQELQQRLRRQENLLSVAAAEPQKGGNAGKSLATGLVLAGNVTEAPQKKGSSVAGGAIGTLKLKWKDGPSAPYETSGWSVAVSGHIIYCCDDCIKTKVLKYNSRTENWIVLQESPKNNFSIAVVNKKLTAVGGQLSGIATNTLLTFQPDRLGQKWIEWFPPMKYSRNSPPVATHNTSLIVAGGWGSPQMTAVEVMDTQTLQWTTVSSLPHPFWQASTAICGDNLYIGGGFSAGDPEGQTNSVLTCNMNDLLHSRPQSNTAQCGPVWSEMPSLPVFFSSLVTFQGQLLAVGGCKNAKDNTSITSKVRQYNQTSNSWNEISKMAMKRCHSFAAILPNNTLMVCGGKARNGFTASIEIASQVAIYFYKSFV